MELYVWICFLKYFLNSRHLVPPFKFQCGQIIRILSIRSNSLFISTPKWQPPYAASLKFALMTLSDDKFSHNAPTS